MTASTVPIRPARSPWLIEARALAVLAGPLIVTQLAQMAILTTDVILLGRLSTDALAAAAIGNAVYYFAWLVGTGPAHAVPPMIAHQLGARPEARAILQRSARATTRMALWGVAVLSLPLIGLLLTAEPILRLAGQDPRLAADAGLFVSMLCFGLPFSLGFQVLRNFSTALGRPNAGLWVMLATIVFNGVVAWALIFGRLGLPAMGIVGAGLATSLSAMFAFAVMLTLTLRLPDLRRHRILQRLHRPSWPHLGELFRLGMPIGVTLLFEAMLFNVMTLVVGTFGADQLAAHQVALNFASVTFMVPLGVALAATIRVGVFAGAQDLEGARRAGLTAMVVGVAAISVFALPMAFYGEGIAGLYLADRSAETLAVIGIAALYLKVAAAFQLADALQVVSALSLRGLKDARMPMILAGASYWLAGAPMCIALGVGLKMGGFGVWLGLAFGLSVAALLMTTRFLRLTRAGARPPLTAP